MNTTTSDELKSKYPVKPLGVNKNNGLEAFAIEPQYIDFADLLAIKAAFSDEGILKLVQMSLPKSKFEMLFNSLQQKYSLVYKNIPSTGNKEAKFEEGNTYIILYAGIQDKDMDFLYINKKLLDDALQIKPQQSPSPSSEQEKTITQL